jgi:hypothetical protein
LDFKGDNVNGYAVYIAGEQAKSWNLYKDIKTLAIVKELYASRKSNWVVAW